MKTHHSSHHITTHSSHHNTLKRHITHFTSDRRSTRIVSSSSTMIAVTTIAGRDIEYTALRIVTMPVFATSARHTPSPHPPRPWYRMLHCKKYFSRALVCLNTSVVRELTAAFIASICFATPHAPRPRPHSRSNSTQFTTSRTELSSVTTTRSCRIFTRFTSSLATPHSPRPRAPFSVCTVFFTACTTTVPASGDARLPRQYTS